MIFLGNSEDAASFGGVGLVVLVIIGAILFINFKSNEVDMLKGQTLELETATVHDYQLTGREAAPTMILKMKDKFRKIYFEDIDKMYSCADVGQELDVYRVIGESGELRGLNISCDWGVFKYRPTFLEF